MFPVIHQEKFQPRTLPWACLFFFAAYLLVYFSYQSGETEQRQALAQWYQESGLYRLEWRNYYSWLRQNGQADKAEQLEQAHERDDAVTVVLAMALDPAFEEENRREGDTYWSASQRFKWQDLRNDLRERKEKIPSLAAGLNPADWVPADFLSYHFLHENLIQWLVGLLVLIPFAWPLESRLGWRRVALVWMLGGVVAGLGYVLFVNSYRPLIGSTAVISAMLGAFFGLYLRERLPFVTLHPKTRRKLVIELPAWVLAPLWLVLPVYEYLGGGLSPHTWVAQLCGLIGGFALVQLVRDTHVEGETEEPEDEEDEQARQLRQRLTSGWTSMAALQFSEAAEQFSAALKLEPDHFDALTGLYQVRKLNPDSEEFAHTATAVLAAHTREKGRTLQQQQIYRDFRKHRETGELPVQTRLQLAMRLTSIDAFKDAEELVESVVKEKTGHELLAKTLYILAEAFERAGNQGKAERFRTLADNARDAA